MNFCLFHSGVEAGSLCGISRQKGLRFYRPLMDYEFGTHLEFLFAVWWGLPGWMRSVKMGQHSLRPCGPDSAYRLPESSKAGGKGARVVPPRDSVSRHLCQGVQLDVCTDT